MAERMAMRGVHEDGAKDCKKPRGQKRGANEDERLRRVFHPPYCGTLRADQWQLSADSYTHPPAVRNGDGARVARPAASRGRVRRGRVDTHGRTIADGDGELKVGVSPPGRPLRKASWRPSGRSPGAAALCTCIYRPVCITVGESLELRPELGWAFCKRCGLERVQNPWPRVTAARWGPAPRRPRRRDGRRGARRCLDCVLSRAGPLGARTWTQGGQGRTGAGRAAGPSR